MNGGITVYLARKEYDGPVTVFEIDDFDFLLPSGKKAFDLRACTKVPRQERVWDFERPRGGRAAIGASRDRAIELLKLGIPEAA